MSCYHGCLIWKCLQVNHLTIVYITETTQISSLCNSDVTFQGSAHSADCHNVGWRGRRDGPLRHKFYSFQAVCFQGHNNTMPAVVRRFLSLNVSCQSL